MQNVLNKCVEYIKSETKYQVNQHKVFVVKMNK